MHLVYNEHTGDFEEVLYVEPPKITAFNMTNGEDTVFKDTVAHFVWSVIDAETVSFNGQDIPDQIFSHDITCEETGLFSFELIAKNSCGETKQTFMVSVIDKPLFNISGSNLKLRKGKDETCELKWEIQFAHEVYMISTEGKQKVSSSDTKILSPSKTETIKFEAIGIDNKTSFFEEITIGVYEESIVEFKANKNYSYPHLPIVLSWSVEHANKIEIDGYGEQLDSGNLIVEPARSTIYRLIVTDEFGMKAYNAEVQMLPLPFIKSIMLPIPNFISNMSVSIKQPRYNVGVKFPNIELGFVTTEIPKVSSLNDLGINVELSPPLPKVNLMSSIKNVFNYITKK